MSRADERALTGTVTSGAREALRTVYHALARSPAAPLLRFPAAEWARLRITATEVSSHDVPYFVGLLSAAGVKSWLVGGWGCDALLGEQTRRHRDLDLVLAEPQRLATACEVLGRDGFVVTEVFDAERLGTAVELLDRRHRRQVALHLVDLTSDGAEAWLPSLRQTMRRHGLLPTEIFATGTVAGHHLPCLSAPALIALHIGYEPHDEDRHDVCRLCTRFSLPVPPAYDCGADAE